MTISMQILLKILLNAKYGNFSTWRYETGLSFNLLIKLLTPLFLRGLHNQDSHVRNLVATVKLFSL